MVIGLGVWMVGVSFSVVPLLVGFPGFSPLSVDFINCGWMVNRLSDCFDYDNNYFKNKESRYLYTDAYSGSQQTFPFNHYIVPFIMIYAYTKFCLERAGGGGKFYKKKLPPAGSTISFNHPILKNL